MFGQEAGEENKFFFENTFQGRRGHWTLISKSSKNGFFGKVSNVIFRPFGRCFCTVLFCSRNPPFFSRFPPIVVAAALLFSLSIWQMEPIPPPLPFSQQKKLGNRTFFCSADTGGKWVEDTRGEKKADCSGSYVL